MFSIEAFCYHHKGLSKFGAPKRPLCFQGGGLKKTPDTDNKVDAADKTVVGTRFFFCFVFFCYFSNRMNDAESSVQVLWNKNKTVS